MDGIVALVIRVSNHAGSNEVYVGETCLKLQEFINDFKLSISFSESNDILNHQLLLHFVIKHILL